MIRKQTLTSWVIALFVMMMPSLLTAQSYAKKTLITIGDNKISAQDFMNTYEKNNVKTDVIDKKNIDEYLDLYIDFKLKVTEAEDLKMDTMPSFVKEFKSYRNQLAKPYFSNDDITEDLVKEAFDRMQYDVNAAHILIKCDAKALPADTIAAYNKAMSIRERILKGEDFSAVAVEMSDDPSARDMEEIPGVRRAYTGNKGELGYFTAFDMVYPFETGVYTTEVGNVSMPIRSDFGYHIIKVNSKTPALGVVKAAHIFLVADPNKADSVLKNKAYNIYNELMEDETQWSNFVKKYSEDRGTVANDGVLSPFRVNQIVPEFITAVKNLELGEISEPVKTNFGYHIIKLVETTPPSDFEAEKVRLEERIERDMRGKISEEIAMKRIMNDNNFKENTKVKDAYIATIDSTLAMGMYQPSDKINTQKVIFTIGNESCKLEEFVDYIVGHQKRQGFLSSSAYAYELYDAFLKAKVFAYEDACLEEKYPELRNLVREYHDGILLFDVSLREVWDKANKDHEGLTVFFKANKKQYTWDEPRYKGWLIYAKTDLAAKAAKQIVKGTSDKAKVDSILNERVNLDSVTYVKVEYGLWTAGKNAAVDVYGFKDKTATYTASEEYPVVVAVGKVLKRPEEYNDDRGKIVTDYQDYLEKLWIASLREKYPVVINEEVWNALKAL